MKMLMLGASIIVLASLNTAIANNHQVNQPSRGTIQLVADQENVADTTQPKDEVVTPTDENATAIGMKKQQEEKNKKEEMEHAKTMPPTMIPSNEPAKNTTEPTKDKTDTY